MTPSELSMLDPEEREAWDLCQKAQDPVWLCSDRAKLSTRKMANLVLALLSKVARLKQERDAAMKSSDENHAKLVAVDQACETAESERDRYKERVGELEEALREITEVWKSPLATNKSWDEQWWARMREMGKQAEAALKGESHG